MHLKYAEMLAIVVHENMKLGDNWLENVNFKHVIFDQKLANSGRHYFTAFNTSFICSWNSKVTWNNGQSQISKNL